MLLLTRGHIELPSFTHPSTYTGFYNIKLFLLCGTFFLTGCNATMWGSVLQGMAEGMNQSNKTNSYTPHRTAKRNAYSQVGNQSYPSNDNSGYLGKLSSNQYDPESVSNPYGQYGNSYSPTSVNNPYGTYGSKYSPVSVTNPYAVGGPKIIDPKSGKYLGNLNSNKYDPDSVSNPYGRYGSTYSPDSINNPYGQYGNTFSPNSVTNPYATSAPIIVAPEE